MYKQALLLKKVHNEFRLAEERLSMKQPTVRQSVAFRSTTREDDWQSIHKIEHSVGSEVGRYQPNYEAVKPRSHALKVNKAFNKTFQASPQKEASELEQDRLSNGFAP